MTISGFSYVRNGFSYGVPFLEAIQSILPICSELVVAVGDSTDGTREAIANLHDSRIKIVDTVWNMDNNERGKIFAQQSNVALDATTGDWAFHIQADEVIHENDLPKIKSALERFNDDAGVEGFILPFMHFWGGYNYVRNSRRTHKHEIRIFRRNLSVRAYRDSLGFRKYSDFTAYAKDEEKGEKLRVKKIDAPIYHYTEVRNPERNRKKETIGYFYQDEVKEGEERVYDYSEGYDRLIPFKGTHPALMKEKVAAQDWNFVFDKRRANWRTKDRIMQPIEDVLGFKIGEYKNYILLK